MKPSSPTADASAARYCADAARAQDSDRYLIALFQPARLRRAAVALAAWNLELANVHGRSGETMLGLMRLQWQRDALAGLAGDAPARHPTITELADACRAGLIAADDLRAIVDARERDLDPEPPETLEELEAYARATAGALHACLWRGSPAAPAAADAATAFALVGLARAEPFNRARGRPWAPKSLEGDLRPIVARGLALAESAVVRAVKAGRAAAAPAVLARGYGRRAAGAGFDATSPAMATPDPWRLWRLMAFRFLPK